MNYTPSGYPSSFQSLDLSQYETPGQPSHNYQHLPQIERMIQDYVAANVPKMIEKMVPKYCQETMRRVVPSMIDAMRADVTTIVSIAFEQGAEIWSDSRTQAYISDAIMRKVEERLNDIVINMDL